MTARLAAIVIGIVFVLVGLLGFVNNPVLGLFQVNPLHNLIHIISGIVLLAGAFSSLGSSMALKIIGVVYALVAICGFFAVNAEGMLLGLIPVNPGDQWLHVVLAVVILVAAFGLPDDDRAMAM
jgi:Domain of unknown function (DUF4383)